MSVHILHCSHIKSHLTLWKRVGPCWQWWWMTVHQYTTEGNSLIPTKMCSHKNGLWLIKYVGRPNSENDKEWRRKTVTDVKINPANYRGTLREWEREKVSETWGICISQHVPNDFFFFQFSYCRWWKLPMNMCPYSVLPKYAAHENCTIIIPKGNVYYSRQSSSRGPRLKVSSEEQSTEIDILIRSPIQVQNEANVD